MALFVTQPDLCVATIMLQLNLCLYHNVSRYTFEFRKSNVSDQGIKRCKTGKSQNLSLNQEDLRFLEIATYTNP